MSFFVFFFFFFFGVRINNYCRDTCGDLKNELIGPVGRAGSEGPRGGCGLKRWIGCTTKH